ncbi:surface lipoprotein assembly modifier [Novosphingobium resinovorum]|uniref:surface lipoprotein assembly modifier n=1 Tax=Novosphingobium resinovorum TaxID=158500 RepID=UPI002ECFF7A4|nr:surface lipoprotein assembly modifier [Novosphingobium resinovorum]
MPLLNISIKSRWRPCLASLLCGGATCFSLPALAQSAGEQDTRLRLDQEIQRQERKTEAQLLEDADALDVPPTLLEIDGKSYSVGDNVNEMGQALYISVRRQQWADARRFLTPYERYPDHDPKLVLFAKGALAREGGKLADAEQYYRELAVLDPNLMSGQLELARVLFENRKDREARTAFEQVRGHLVAEGEKSAGVVRTVDAFLRALKQRRGWQGNIAIGPGYSTNLNQSSESYTCLLVTEDGSCLFDRQLPDAIKATGINFEGSLGRSIPISGHHGLRARALVFGDIYPSENDYSQATLITRLGYQYQSARDTFSLSPSFDIGTLGSSVLYNAWGANLDWTHTASRNILFRAEVNYRDYRYHQRSFSSQDGPLTDVSLTAFYVAWPGWTLFGGPDFTAKDTPAAVNAYRQWGGRLGVSKSFGKSASLLLIGSYRHRDHRAYSQVFAAKRSDDQYNVTAIARFPALQFVGLVPELVVQHTHVESNIDWLYSYKRTTVSVRLNHAF